MKNKYFLFLSGIDRFVEICVLVAGTWASPPLMMCSPIWQSSVHAIILTEDGRHSGSQHETVSVLQLLARFVDLCQQGCKTSGPEHGDAQCRGSVEFFDPWDFFSSPHYSHPYLCLWSYVTCSTCRWRSRYESLLTPGTPKSTALRLRFVIYGHQQILSDFASYNCTEYMIFFWNNSYRKETFRDIFNLLWAPIFRR
jgi:hypothetical protein